MNRFLRLSRFVTSSISLTVPSNLKRGFATLSSPTQFTRLTVHRNDNFISYFSTNCTEYEDCSDETLESLSEKFDELLESDPRMIKADATLSSGVLTISIPSRGTYVLNKQSPNQQIWLSSPISGPSRFDMVMNKGWVNRRTDETLHTLLNREFGQNILLREDCGFQDCYFADGKLED